LQLESKANVQKLIDILVTAESVSLLTSAANIIIALVKRLPNEGGPLDPKKKFEELSNVLQVVSENLYKLPPIFKNIPSELKNFQDLEKKGCKPSISSVGPSLGFRRLKLVELCSAMACTAFEAIDSIVMKSDVLESVTELFFIHQWNNVLHLEVEQMMAYILEKNNEELKIYVLKECKLLDRIVEASNLNEEAIANHRVRRGNMGHITSIAVNISNTPNIESLIQKAVGKHIEWEKYRDGILFETVERNRTSYGSGYNQDETFTVGSSIEPSVSVIPIEPSLSVIPIEPSLSVIPTEPSLSVIPIEPSLSATEDLKEEDLKEEDLKEEDLKEKEPVNVVEHKEPTEDQTLDTN